MAQIRKWKMNQISSLTLNQDQIGYLLTLIGETKGNPLSPLSRERFPGGGESDKSLLLEEGIIDPRDRLTNPWNQSFQILSQPHCEIVAAVGFPRGRKALCGYCASGDAGTLVGFTSQNEQDYRLDYPLSKDHFLSFLTNDLGLDAETSVLGLEAEMETDTLLTLAGMIDAEREAQLEGMLAREPEPDGEIRFDRILYNTRKGLNTNDYRWLASAVSSLSPFELRATSETLLQHLNELQQLGWVEEREEDMWSITEAFDIPRRHLESLVNFGLLSIQHQDQKGIKRVYVGMLRTMATLWSLDFQTRAGGKTMVRIGTVSGPNLAETLDRLLEIAIEPPPVSQAERDFQEPVPSKNDKNICPRCHTPGQPGDRFCSACGAELK
jgi:hypothetical protein